MLSMAFIAKEVPPPNKKSQSSVSKELFDAKLYTKSIEALTNLVI